MGPVDAKEGAKTGSKTTSVLGWVAVAMSTLVACFGIMFLTGDAITECHHGAADVGQLDSRAGAVLSAVIVAGLGQLAVAVPRSGFV